MSIITWLVKKITQNPDSEAEEWMDSMMEESEEINENVRKYSHSEFHFKNKEGKDDMVYIPPYSDPEYEDAIQEFLNDKDFEGLKNFAEIIWGSGDERFRNLK